MKSSSRMLLLLMLLLAMAPMPGVINSASANTELVPAARLVAPFVDISSGRDTFLLITNISHFLPLTRTPFTFTVGTPAVTIADTLGWGVHLEFYAATCATTSRTIDLSKQDIDQLDLLVSPNLTGQLPGGTATQFQSGVSGRGWVDIDIRRGSAGATDQSVQANVLLGTVVITDFANDFAFAYPMAADIGSAASGLGGVIVRRSPSILWSGRYEPFPPRLFVPAYFAEGTGTGGIAGQVFSTFLVLAGPADGNWSGVDGGTGAGDANTGEPPGQVIGDGGQGGDLINIPNSLLFDGCEEFADRSLNGHYINASLGSIYGITALDRANWTAANCTAHTFPGLDEFSGQPVGWVDLPNTLTSKGTNTGATRPTLSTTGGIGVNRVRGMVGVFLENVVGGTPTLHLGDATRLWGDCSFTQSEQVLETCTNSPGLGSSTTCRCSLVDTVCHIDTAQSEGGFPTDQVPTSTDSLGGTGRCDP